MAKGATTREFDRGFIHIMKELRKLEDKPYVKVGIQGAKGNAQKKGTKEPLTVVEVAVYNEFGAPKANIPERPFMRSTYDTKRSEWQDLTDRLQDGIYKGLTIDKALDVLGLKMQADVIARIRSSPSWAVPNAESTYLRKLNKSDVSLLAHDVGDVKPLIDTGQMVESVTSVKVMKRSDDYKEGVQS